MNDELIEQVARVIEAADSTDRHRSRGASKMKLGDRAELVQEIVEWLQRRNAQSAMDVDTAEMIHAIFSPYACQNARDEAYRDGQERGLKRLCRFVVGGFSKAYANLKPRGSFGSPAHPLVEKPCRPTANGEAGEHLE